MSGWVPVPADDWFIQRAHIQGEWPEVLVVLDLRFWEDNKACGGRKRPSLRDLGLTWGWSKSRVNRFIADREKWSDSFRERDNGGTLVGQQRDNSGTREPVNPDTFDGERDTSGTPAGHSWDNSGTVLIETRARSPHPTPTPHNDPPSEGVPATSGRSDPPLPKWARTTRVPPGVSKSDVVDLVVSARDAAVGKPGNPERAGTAARDVLGLWRAVGCPLIPAFRDELLLVIEAAKDCPDPLFARDIRAEGWPDGTDRHRDLSTLCRRDRWDVRLDAATRWHAAGRPTSAPARASPARSHGGSGGGMGDVARRLLEEMDDDVDDATFTVEATWTT